MKPEVEWLLPIAMVGVIIYVSWPRKWERRKRHDRDR